MTRPQTYHGLESQKASRHGNVAVSGSLFFWPDEFFPMYKINTELDGRPSDCPHCKQEDCIEEEGIEPNQCEYYCSHCGWSMVCENVPMIVDIQIPES